MFSQGSVAKSSLCDNELETEYVQQKLYKNVNKVYKAVVL
jgi:hypothetical protein